MLDDAVVMRVDRRFLGWGVFFILLGGIPLAVAQGWIPDDLAWWQLWPLVLVGIGISLVLRRTPAGALGGLLVAATVGAIIGGTLASGVQGVPGIGCVGGSGGQPFTSQAGELTGSTAKVELEVSCGDVSVVMADGSTWSVSGSSDGGRVPRIDASADRLTVRGDDSSDILRDRSSWIVGLPRGPLVDLSTTLNAGSATIDLSGARVADLSVTVNAGSATVDAAATETFEHVSMTVNAGAGTVALPPRSMTGSLSANAGSVTFCVDLAAVGLSISTDANITAGNDFDEAGLVEVSPDHWQTPGYAEASQRIDLTAGANAGSLSLNPEEGCGG